MKGVWFKTGLKMADGKARTVLAETEAEVCDFKEKGWKPVKVKIEVKRAGAVLKSVVKRKPKAKKSA